MRDQNGIRRLLSGILLIALVHQWMRPLSDLSNWTDVYSIAPLVITIAGVLAVDVLMIPRLFTWIVKLMIILSAVAAMFQGKNLLHLDLWISYSILFMNDVIYITIGQWNSVSAEGRTFLFIGAWSTAVCWLYSVILYQRIALYTTIFTVGYLVILQTWLGLNTTKGVVLAVIVGLLLHGLSVLPVLESLFGLRAKLPGWPLRWVLSSIFLVSITVGCGLLLSMGQERAIHKFSMRDWNWQSLEVLAPFAMQSFPGYMNKQVDPLMKSGYSQSDTNLGGSVKSDDSIAFLANTERPDAYWRGESKAVYDGKGWSSLANDLYGYEIGSVLPDVLSTWSDSVLQQESMIIQEVFPMPEYPNHDSSVMLLSNGAIRLVDRVITNQGNVNTETMVTIDQIEGKFTLQGGGSSSITSYTVQSTAPVTSETAEQMLTDSDSDIGGPVPVSISIPNLQLPDPLPERISILTRSITEEFDTPWEKAEAISQYLQIHYRYTLTPKKVEQEGDFVDLFLFEQKEGYCDYFSTAMTIMLRSIGIPARWVKGFTPGEIITADQNEFLLESSARLRSSQVKTTSVMVSNRNAHSWVEVYISGIGWTSFDPTPGSLAVTTPVSRLDATSLGDGGFIQSFNKYLSNIVVLLSDKRTLSALLWTALFTVFCLLSRVIYNSTHIRRWLELIHIRLLMLKYAWGITTPQADTRLLERILNRAFTRYGQSMHPGKTLRESVVSSSFPVSVVEPLLELLSLYELARYGPLHRKRIPYESVVASWRILC